MGPDLGKLRPGQLDQRRFEESCAMSAALPAQVLLACQHQPALWEPLSGLRPVSTRRRKVPATAVVCAAHARSSQSLVR